MQPISRLTKYTRSRFFLDNHPENPDLRQSLTRLERLIEDLDSTEVQRLKQAALWRKNLRTE